MTDDAGPDPARRARRVGPRAERGAARGWRSLCQDCTHVKLVRSEHGSTFFLCRLAATDPRFAKYPAQPVLDCSGFER
jgi:hypothetical protein